MSSVTIEKEKMYGERIGSAYEKLEEGRRAYIQGYIAGALDQKHEDNRKNATEEAEPANA